MHGGKHASDVIVLFDGACALCHGSVRFIIKHDPRAHFRFATLQSPAGKRLLERRGLSPQPSESVVLIEGESCFTKGDAALRIARRLSGLKPLPGLLYIIPAPLRNWGYDRIAKNRHRWFGKRDSCITLTHDIIDRFVA